MGAHIISRFVDRRHYLVDDADRGILLRAIGAAQHRWDWQWLSWALMSSHVHYGLVAGCVAPDSFFKSVHTTFAQRFHQRRGGQTLGPVFANRPSLHTVPQRRLARLVAYHHRNPVTAGVVHRAVESRWTSHRVYLRLDSAPAWFDVERAMAAIGFDDHAAGRRAFDDFVMHVDLRGVTPRAEAPACAPSIVAVRAPRIDWTRLIAMGRQVTGLERGEDIGSRRRRAATTRLVVAVVAVRYLGQTVAQAASRLRMTSGSLHNAIARGRSRPDVVRMVRELARRWSDAAAVLRPPLAAG